MPGHQQLIIMWLEGTRHIKVDDDEHGRTVALEFLRQPCPRDRELLAAICRPT